MNEEAKKILKDAEELWEKAMEEIDFNLRDSAEKAWGATVRATDALITAKRKITPTGRDAIRVRRDNLEDIALRELEVERLKLVERFYTRESSLHGTCFYEGHCYPEEAVKRRIKETKDYIEDVRKLADL